MGRKMEASSFYNLAAECRLCCPLVVEAAANLPRFKVGTSYRPSLPVWIFEVNDTCLEKCLGYSVSLVNKC